MNSVLELKAELKNLLMNEKDVLAAWEGGSAATGYLDEYSDLDLVIVTEEDCTEQVFSLLESYFSQSYGIERSFRLPEPTWHGMSQCFYLLKDFSACFYCDIAVVAKANPNKLTEPDRHGNAVVWFDQQAVFTAEPISEEKRMELVTRVLKSATALDFLMLAELQKSLLRNNWPAALMNWHSFLNRCLLPLLNIRHRPAKADFGIRYMEREYPPDMVSRLENYLRCASVDDISRHWATALPLYQELKTELSALYLK
ncbi:MAG: nucleotidyltransferase domain-containing protein [Candidatus Cloacimonetes bacterium]|nr:nucleotidyltransferase domain-containing protein [Candidatus Cloacimonadota bacterium]